MSEPNLLEEENEGEAIAGTPVNGDEIDPARIDKVAPRRISPRSLQSALRSELFLGLLVLTLLNAVVFLHYARTRQAALDMKQANLIVRTEMGRDADYYSPISEFITLHGEFVSQTDSIFASSLAKFRGRLARFGIDVADTLQKDDFQRRNKGLYWSPRTRDDLSSR